MSRSRHLCCTHRHRFDVGVRVRALAFALFLLFACCPGMGSDREQGSVEDNLPESCALCASDPGLPIVQLTSARFDSMARLDADFNSAQIARLDSLYRAGTFGPSQKAGARRLVHLMARLTTINAYRELARLARDSTRIWEADETSMHAVLARYSDVSLFCGVRLQRARLGLGHVCLHYDLSRKMEGETLQGGKPMRFEIKDVEIRGRQIRVLTLDLPTSAADMVEVLLSSHYTFDVEYVLSAGPPGPYEWFLVHDIRGGWLRKWGTHHPTAFMFWVTPPESTSTDVPVEPLAGVRIYIPRLELRLPWILPDFDVDDLREVELPQPILDMEYLQQQRFPAWLEVDRMLAFVRWRGYGPVPPAIRQRFPNL